jgi:hypothetical protein
MYLPRYLLQPHEDVVINTSSVTVDGLNMLQEMDGDKCNWCACYEMQYNYWLRTAKHFLTVVNSLCKYYVGHFPLRYRYLTYTFEELLYSHSHLVDVTVLTDFLFLFNFDITDDVFY